MSSRIPTTREIALLLQYAYKGKDVNF
jgi:hypothetical protein